MAKTSAERTREHRLRKKLAKEQGILGSDINGINFTQQWFTYYREKLSCEVCGESCSAVLEFHHLDPTQKYGNVSTMVAHGESIAVVLSEIAKCKVLCRNCHAKVHAGLIRL